MKKIKLFYSLEKPEISLGTEADRYNYIKDNFTEPEDYLQINRHEDDAHSNVIRLTLQGMVNDFIAQHPNYTILDIQFNVIRESNSVMVVYDDNQEVVSNKEDSYISGNTLFLNDGFGNLVPLRDDAIAELFGTKESKFSAKDIKALQDKILKSRGK